MVELRGGKKEIQVEGGRLDKGETGGPGEEADKNKKKNEAGGRLKSMQ